MILPSSGALLRACGGISTTTIDEDDLDISSPRVRRYFLDQGDQVRAARLFSARAEVFPSDPDSMISRATLLRACGGISEPILIYPGEINSSPRVRRYFQTKRSECEQRSLFSARAEVFPSNKQNRPNTGPLLRACGGISRRGPPIPDWPPSSPRVRRYFRRKARE